MALRWVLPKKLVSSAKLKQAVPARPAAATRAGVAARPAAARRDVAADWARMWLLATLNAGLPVHDPQLSPRDEAIFLLHTAAEIEHSLLVQYLYAAYSLKSSADDRAHGVDLDQWRTTLTTIAKEEMGHLMTDENLLILLGAPVNFERQDMPFRSSLYPFHFRLEPTSKESLAKYVLAEMPEDPNNELLTKAQKKELRKRAKLVESDAVNRVGSLYAKLLILFSPPGDAMIQSVRDEVADGELAREFDRRLADSDFLPADSPGLKLQGPQSVWELPGGPDINIFVPTVTTRAQAVDALKQLMAQGEAGHGTPDGEESHFQRFWKLFNAFPETNAKFGKKGWVATRRVPVDPNTLISPPRPLLRGNISLDRSRQWATLFNIRYRMLLDTLAHYLQLTPIDDSGTYRFAEKRGFLEGFGGKAVIEMRALTTIADVLTGLDRTALPRKGKAGPPFELLDSLSLPARDEERWRWHLQRHQEFDVIVDALLPNEPPETQAVLDGLKLDDGSRQQMESFAGVNSGGGSGGGGSGGGGSGGGGGTATTSFARDIRPLFQPIDVAHMRFALDLSKYDDVKQNSGDILNRLKGVGGQRMPPPPAPAWPQVQIDLFAQWIAEGHPQ